MSKVIGIDPSLTSTGVAVIDADGKGEVHRIKSKACADDLLSRHNRLTTIAAQVAELLDGADLVVIENPAYSATKGSLTDRYGLWWMLVNAAIERGIPTLNVMPNIRAKYSTGRGNSGKDLVLAATVRRYQNIIDLSGNDEADAWLFAAIGKRLLGEPIEDGLPLANLEALKTLTLPE